MRMGGNPVEEFIDLELAFYELTGIQGSPLRLDHIANSGRSPPRRRIQSAISAIMRAEYAFILKLLRIRCLNRADSK